MPSATLRDRALISVSGEDAETFLQNIITLDLNTLAGGEAAPSALLSPQGKVMFDFLVSRAGENGLVLETRADVADDLVRRLTLYRLRAKVVISKQEQGLVTVAWNFDSDASQSESTASRIDSGWLRDKRFPGTVSRLHGAAQSDAGPEAWQRFRIDSGVPESGSDYTLGDAFPHDVLLDQLGGVGFKKGCYVGQEVVSRMQHRGTARRRALLVHGASDLPPPGTEVAAGGRALGSLGSVDRDKGLAIVRIDRAREALDAGTPIMAGDVAVDLAIPAFASFTWPQAAAASNEG